MNLDLSIIQAIFFAIWVSLMLSSYLFFEWSSASVALKRKVGPSMLC
jgi:hypothetical protein